VTGADEDRTAAGPTLVGLGQTGWLETVLAALAAEACVVLPTDTVYGVAARADRPEAVDRLQAAKGRGDDFPPPVLLADPADLAGLVGAVPGAAARLAELFWPGPLTLVLPLAPGTGLWLGSPATSLAVRVPDLDPLRRLLRRSGPLACSSANRHGQPPATSVEQARAALGPAVACYVDGGPGPGPAPSSIVSFLDGPDGRLLRRGRLEAAALLAVAPRLRLGPAGPDGPEAG
jgi:tRNA threonylcarbamoyl adenosine modification protein (Sua5/YciO/YrdC/YwlC family)